LRLAGSYACTDAPPDTLAAGEGLLGQGWLDRQERWLTGAALPDRRIRSGLGDCAPAAMLLSPVLLNDQCLGIVELAFLRAPDASARAALGEWIDLLAMNLQMQARTRSTHAKLHESLEHDRARGTQMLFQQALVDTIPYPVFYKGPDSRFLGFNRAYEAAFNIRRQDMIGKRVLDLEYLPEADRLAYQAEDEAVIASTGSIQHRMRIPYADGVTRDTLYFVSGFRLPDGSPGGLVGTFIDLSTIGQPADTAQESGT
jgi:PAS domain-containing protein